MENSKHKRRNVLLLEKETIISLDWKKAMIPFDYHLSVANNLEEALFLLKTQSFDLIILGLEELKLPELNLLDYIRIKHPKSKVVVSSCSRSIKENLKWYNISRIILKPFDSYKELKKMLEILEDSFRLKGTPYYE